LGVKLIGTVSSPEKAALAKAHGAWQVIDYSRENVVERVMELTKGKKVPVVYDGVGKDTWVTSLDCLQPRGLMVSYGNASGAVDGVNLGILAAKGSLFVTRPTLGTHVNTAEKMQAAADELFDLVLKKKIKVRIDQRYPLEQAGAAQTALAARKTTGATVFTLD
jgi:NADPH2:quinone reductase